jgi:enoyl-CoA hydratase/carnithine racemase
MTAYETSTVRYERVGDVAVVTLDNPRHNLVSAQLSADLLGVLEGPVAADGARAVMLRAEGKIFSAGADVGLFPGRADREPDGGPDEARLRPLRLLYALENVEVPTVACVQGLCLAAGFELALACDLIVAGESARLGLVEGTIGLSPLMGGVQRVVARAGPARARELTYSAQRYDAATLERWNVINAVVPDDRLGEEAMALVSSLAAGPTQAHRITKRVVRACVDDGVRAADAVMTDETPALFATDDLRNGLESFFANGPGKATFTGR